MEFTTTDVAPATTVDLERHEDDGRALYVPEGFAHGFQALGDDVVLLYQVSTFYTPGMDTYRDLSTMNDRWERGEAPWKFWDA